MCFSKNPKGSPNIWATFVRRFVAKNFKKSSIWSHCSQGMSILSFIVVVAVVVRVRQIDTFEPCLRKGDF